MGGIVDHLASGAADLAAKTAGHTGGGLMDAASKGITSLLEHSEGFFKSNEALFKTTPSGAPFVEGILKGKYFPQLKQGFAEQLAQQVKVGQAHDPIKAMATAREMARAKTFGANDELLIDFVHRARKESGSNAHADNVGLALSTMFHENFEELHKPTAWGIDENGVMRQPKFVKRPVTWLEKAGVTKAPAYTKPTELEKHLRNAMGYVFTPFIAIPHLTQILNPVLDMGIKHVANGISDLMEKSPKNLVQLARSGVMADEMYYSMVNPEAGWMKKIFHHPGFTPVRKKYLEIAALAGRSALYDSAAEFLESKGADKASGVMLKHLGLNPAEFLARQADHTLRFDAPQNIVELGLNGGHLSSLRLTSNDVLTAMYRSGSESMFIRDGLNTPYAWDTTPLRRMMFMYKHYAFAQGKFLRDVLYRAYDAGGIPAVSAKLAIIGTALPAAGEIIKGAERWAHGDTDSATWQDGNVVGKGDASEYLDAMAHVAGFGMMYSTIRSAQRHALAGMVVGPLFNSLIDVAQDVVNLKGKNMKQTRHGDSLSPSQKKLGRDIVGRAGLGGPLISRVLFPKKVVHHKDVINQGE